MKKRRRRSGSAHAVGRAGPLAVSAMVALLARSALASGTPAGAQFRVNQTTLGRQNQPAVAMNAAGQVVFAWSNGTGLNISARAYQASGQARTGEIVVNATTGGTQNEPTVAMDGAGNFVVAWTDYNDRDGDALGVIAQRYTASGQRSGPEFAVASLTAGSQFQGSAAMGPLGSFVIAWVDSTAAGNPDVWARRFLADGSPLGSQFRVNVRTDSNQVLPAAAMADDGRFVIAWMDRGAEDGSGHGVFFRLYESNGLPLTGDVSAPLLVSGDQRDPYVAAAGDGRFVVAWTDWAGHDGSGAGIFFRVFDRNAVARTGQILGNDVVIGNQFSSPVGIDAQGRVLVAWTETSGRDGSQAGVFARCFDAGGAPLGPSLPANSRSVGDQAAPWVAVSGGGAAVVGFEDRGGADGDSDGVFARGYFAPSPPSPIPAIGPLGLALLSVLIVLAASSQLKKRLG